MVGGEDTNLGLNKMKMYQVREP